MSAKNVLLGGSLILAILLIGSLIVTATFMLYGNYDNSVTGLATASAISEEQASTIALGTVKGTIKKIELEQEKGRYIYEVEVDKDGREFEVSIDSVTGKIMGIEEKIKEQNPEVEPLISSQSSGSIISKEDAIRIAEDRLSSDFDLEEVGTRNYKGKKVWGLEFESGSEEAEVIIDMETGEILNIEYDEEDDDDEY